jgi:DNA-binding response OmpR family regulator
MGKRRVLVVEDDLGTRRALRGLFHHAGWEVIAVGTVAAGLEALDPPPDCAVLDLMLPDGDGEVILKKVREDGLPTCVAVCTGTMDPDRIGAVEALRPEALLQKPVDMRDVFAAFDARKGG